MISDLTQLGLSHTSAREILEARHAGKVVRSMATDHQLATLHPFLEAQGLSLLLSHTKYLIATDEGKGGYSNAFGEEVDESHPNGYFVIYIGENPLALQEARLLDENGDDVAFGKLLGIPQCCAEHFARHRDTIATKQNDPSSVMTTHGNPSPWALHFPQYFGYGLFSHFPCSWNCEATKTIAKRNAHLLKEHSSSLGDFMHYQTCSYLYTERDGVYAFTHVTELESGFWSYDPKQIEMSSTGLLAQILRTSNRIKQDGGRLKILKDEVITVDADLDGAILCFHETPGELGLD